MLSPQHLMIMFVIGCNSALSSSAANNSSTSAIYMSGFDILNQVIRKSSFYSTDGYFFMEEGKTVKILIFGKFTADTHLKVSTDSSCKQKGAENKLHILDGTDSTVAEVTVTFPNAKHEHTLVYFCLRVGSAPSEVQGKSSSGGNVRPGLTVKLIKTIFPFWVLIVFIIVLLLLSALFSGLNLGLLSLDKTDLKVIINTGSQKERMEALAIAPVRNHGNFLLCSLLFSNVLVNTVLTLVMDSVFGGGGEATVIVTTLAIVLFGEIVPQAVCSRYGLMVGAKTIVITKFFMTLTFPVAYPVGKILDQFLGEEVGAVYTRDRLKELLKVTRDQHGLENEEMGIISGTLEMRTKTVKEVMTPLENMFMVPSDAILNVELLVNIEDSGFTRIPVYSDERWNVVGVLNVKQLTLYDPSQKLSVKKQIEHHKAHLFCVFENTRLDYMLKAFREGNRGHMAFVQRINDEGPGDPKYETIGLVTLEDVLEELLQAEIYDENDVERLQTKSELFNTTATSVTFAKT